MRDKNGCCTHEDSMWRVAHSDTGVVISCNLCDKQKYATFKWKYHDESL